MRRLLPPILLLIAVLLPAATTLHLQAATPATPGAAAPRSAPVVPGSGRYDRLWLVVSARTGLRVSTDVGRHWSAPAGLPQRGTFYSVVADVARPGTAFLSNGDVYATTDGGRDWRYVGAAPAASGPAGITVLASDPRLDVLYAAGSTVRAYRGGHWEAWVAGWPADVRPTALLPDGEGGLYAAAAHQLFYAANGRARWQPLSTEVWDGGTVTAMAIGPDGATPYIAVRGAGVWSVDHNRTMRRVAGVHLPAGTTVYALQSDPQGADLYAATDRGLYVRHQNATYNVFYQGNRWRRVHRVPDETVAALRPTRGGLLAITASGTVYEGTRMGQALSWRRLGASAPRENAPIIAALVGAEWLAAPPPSPLPSQFTQNCVQVGPSNPFDVCGPFREFYLHFKYTVLGVPRELATVGSHGVVRQTFDNVVLQWTPQRGVFLAPLGRLAAGRRSFPHPTRAQIQQTYTPLVDGYFVEPLFYQFWLQNSWHGVSIFGNPISQLVTVSGANGTGLPVQVQYFTNARLEYHPERPPGSQFQLSPLGLQLRSP